MDSAWRGEQDRFVGRRAARSILMNLDVRYGSVHGGTPVEIAANCASGT